MIQRFGLRKFMALDESFNNVSAEYIPNVSKLLKSLCDDQGFDMLLVTHQEGLAAAADNVYKVSPGPVLAKVDAEDLDDMRALCEI
jgi:ABC-type thiamine transport system ATPase subunit